MKQPVFTGSGVALVTPFKNDFVNFAKLDELIEYHIENGSDALIVCGTTGEASTQTIPEHLATIEYCVKRADGRIKIIAGTGSNDTAHAVMMSTNAEKSGADALLLVTPYYNKTTQKGLIQHYNCVADHVNIPCILYNVPSRTGVGMTAETYRELAKHPNINGVKEASGNFSLIAKTKAICPEDFYIWSGNDDQTVAMMSLGAKGVISVAANIMPKKIVEMTHDCLDGKFGEALKIQSKILDLMNTLFIEVNPIPIKTAMNLLGWELGHLRMPLTDMEDKNLETLKKSLINAGFELKG